MIQDTITQNIIQNIDNLNKKMDNKNLLIQVLMKDNVEMKKRIKELEDRINI